jgi:alpha-glucosidase
MKMAYRVHAYFVLSLLFVVALSAPASAKYFSISSPNEEITIDLQFGEQLTSEVRFRSVSVFEATPLGITVDGQDLCRNVTVAGNIELSEVDETYRTKGVHNTAHNHYRQAVLPLQANGENPSELCLEIRVFDDAVAYRYRVPGESTRRINGEQSSWILSPQTQVWSQSADNRSYEARYKRSSIEELSVGRKIMAPALVKFPNGGGYGLITEANLVNYSDMALQVAENGRVRAVFHDNPEGWQHEGEIVSPWRVSLLAKDLNALVNSDAIKNLCPAPDARLENASWIRPGRSTWHWLTGGGPKLAEQNKWIDGAHELGYEFHLIDDGWKNWNGGGDKAWQALADTIQYAQSQEVDIWLWVNASEVFNPNERQAYFDRVKKLGVVGLKIDFPKPANDEWVRWYDETLRDAATIELMINFHGACKPTGRERTWPHEMTREGICGREQGKLPASHDTTLPFLRYVQGHADYTPTLFIPGRLDGSSLAHELAMAIVYTSPFLCMGDAPWHYLDSPAEDVIRALPATWDETKVLPGSEVGELAAFARRSGKNWYIGVINGADPRELEISLDFLQERYRLTELTDTAERNDELVRNERAVDSDTRLITKMRGDGGYVAWLIAESE